MLAMVLTKCTTSNPLSSSARAFLNSSSLRVAMGREGRRIAEAKYDLSQVAPRIQVALGQPATDLPAGHAEPGASGPKPCLSAAFRR